LRESRFVLLSRRFGKRLQKKNDSIVKCPGVADLQRIALARARSKEIGMLVISHDQHVLQRVANRIDSRFIAAAEEG